jgi:hypothetical protein
MTDSEHGARFLPDWALEAKAALNVAAAFVPPLSVVPAFLDYLEPVTTSRHRAEPQLHSIDQVGSTVSNA